MYQPVSHVMELTNQWQSRSPGTPGLNDIVDTVVTIATRGYFVSPLITGSAVALHCCKAHSKINRKMGNSTPCKIVTPENFNLKLCIRDYVGEATHHANFGSNRYSGGFSPYRRNIHHHHHQFNTHECSMNNKIHEKADTIIQKESTKKIQKDE